MRDLSTRQLQKYWDMPNPNPQLGAKITHSFSAKLWVRVKLVPILLQLTSSQGREGRCPIAVSSCQATDVGDVSCLEGPRGALV